MSKQDVLQFKGKVVELPHKGPVKDTVTEILGGVRSTCTYIGAKRLKDMAKCTTFVRVNNQVNNVFNQFNKNWSNFIIMQFYNDK